MDDKQLENILKNKLDGYQDFEYDESASTAFNERISMLDARPWYIKYSTVSLVAASFALFALMNYLIIKDLNKSSEQRWKAEIIDYQNEIIKLQNKANQLNLKSADTVYLLASSGLNQPSPITVSQVLENQSLLQRLIEKLIQNSTNNTIKDINEKEIFPMVASLTNIPSDYSIIGNDIIPNQISLTAKRKNNTINKAFNKKGKFSIKTIRNLKKHYSKGIGIKVGGELEFLANLPNEGTIKSTVRTGILSEFVLSPSISIETGLKYFQRKHSINRNEINLNTFPGIDESLGVFKDSKIESKILEIPVNLKYYHFISNNKQIYLTTGYSPNIVLSQNFQNNYNLSDRVGESPSNEPITISNSIKYNKSMWDRGTINVGLGLSYDLSENKIVQVDAFYQRSVSGLGREDINQNLFGVKLAYQFRIR